MPNIHSLSYKTGLFTGILVLIIISLLSIIQYYIQKDKVITVSENFMTNKVEKLSNTIDLQIKDRQKNVNTAMNLAHNFFYNSGGIIESSHKNIEMTATNQISKKTHNVSLKSWYNFNNPIHNNFIIVDSIKNMSVETVTIFQKIDSGYLRISTNVMKLNNTRAVGTYIPNNSIVIRTVESGKTYIGRAFVVNAWYLTAYEPIYINGKIKGILYVGVKEKNFTEIEKLFVDDKYKSLKLNLATKNKHNKIEINTKDSILGELLQKELYKNKDNNNNRVGHFIYKDNENIEKAIYYNYNASTNSYIVLTINNNELNSSLDGLLILNIVIGIIIAIIITILLSVYMSKIILIPLKNVVNAMKKISEKNINFHIVLKRKDEIGELYSSINEVNMNFREIIKNIRKTSSTVFATGEQLNSVSEEISKRANQQSTTTNEIASSMEQMLAMISKNMENAELTENIANKSATEIQASNKVFMQTIQSVTDISKKTSIISDIAYRTNILSLNAAIEATTAGSYGKGFSVVASEIRKLAEKSEVASKQITILSNKGKNISVIAGSKLKEIIPEILKSSQLVKEIVTANKEQQSGIKKINNSILELTNITSENSATAEEMTESAELLSKQAKQLKELISVFKV